MPKLIDCKVPPHHTLADEANDSDLKYTKTSIFILEIIINLENIYTSVKAKNYSPDLQ